MTQKEFIDTYLTFRNERNLRSALYLSIDRTFGVFHVSRAKTINNQYKKNIYIPYYWNGEPVIIT